MKFLGYLLILLGVWMVGSGLTCAYLYIFDGFFVDSSRAMLLSMLTLAGPLVGGSGVIMVADA